MANFYDLEAGLRNWATEVPEYTAFEQPLHRRLARALQSFRKDPESVGSGDLAGLVRQLLRSESLERNHDVELDVPVTEGWPSREEWRSFGVEVRLDLGQSYRIVAREWAPAWVEGGLTDVLAVRGSDRSPIHSNLQADPLIKQDLHIKEFRSPGQAAAIRAMSLLPSGQSLVIGLPTGSGKSLVFQAAAIRAGRTGELTVVVVPTTALALDQEIRMQELLNHTLPHQAAYPIAYHSGLSAEDKRAFRQRLRRGEQYIVIASPETAVGALRITLQAAADDGRLAWLAIDEAHMVSQWGETFRPEFQFLAASVASWRRTAPEGRALRTMLLTATLTDECLETLHALFAPGGSAARPSAANEYESDGFHVLVAPELRAEPDYWVVAAPDEASRGRHVAEAIRHLPRPLIVYTVRREHAAILAESLRTDLNLRRVALFRGGDAATTRGTDDLKGWNAGDLDIVVATSAFGLGMDNSDVRAVVHACVPETVDRFYQEVGRAGRDGRAALSLWLHAPADREIAANLGRNRLIGLERGWERWDMMRTNAVRVEQIEDAWRVRLDDKPADLWEENDANRAWNVRTLVLMARAGLISLGTPEFQLPEPSDDESDGDYEQRVHAVLDEAFGCAMVIENTSITAEVWRNAISSTKTRARERDEDDQRRLEALVTVQRPFNETFAETYTLTLDARRVGPTPFQGQCPLTRKQLRHDDFRRIPADFAFTKGLLAEISRDVSFDDLSTNSHHWVTYITPKRDTSSRRSWIARVNKFLRHLVREGIVEIALPEALLDKINMRLLIGDAKSGYVVVRRLDETDPIPLDDALTELPLPRATLLPPEASCGRQADRLLDLRRPMHAIILPASMRDPDRPDRCFVATRHPHDRMERLLESWSL